MTSWKTLVFVPVLLSMMMGCTAAIRGFPDPPRTSTVEAPDPDYLLGKNALRKYNEENSSEKKKILRNEIIDARMDEIDNRFVDFERELYGQGIGFGIGADWALLGLTTATTVAGGESTKTALGAASTGIAGAHASYDKRALFDKTLPSLIAQMVAQRESIRASIRTNEELPVEKYSVYCGLSDLKRFEFAGSIPGSLQAIAEDAGQKAGAAKNELKDIRKAAYAKTKAGDLLRKFWKPDGKTIDESNQTRLREWMQEKSLATGRGTITMFLRSDVLEEARVRAVQDLGLAEK